MLVPAFILAVALCPDCDFQAVSPTLLTEYECVKAAEELAAAHPYRTFDCAPVPGRTVEIIDDGNKSE